MNIFGKTNFDFIAIGDIVVDDFIKIKDAEIENDEKNGHQEICFSFGDKIPYSDRYLIPAVGNSPNAAVAAARLGLRSALVSNLGNDKNGDICLAALRANHVDSRFVQTHENFKTNYHYVLWYGDNRTILIKHGDYPYSLPDIGQPKWIYLSSLGENSLPFHNEIADHLDAHPTIKLAFQPGTYQMRFSAQDLSRIYARTELFFCNRSEAKKILRSDSDDIDTLAKGLKSLGPKTVFITDGHNGVYWFNQDRLKHLPIYPNPNPPIESTGAGDAFSGTVTSGLQLGLTLEEAVKWGLINSMSVVQQIGAQAGLLTREKIQDYLEKTPAGYLIRKI